jgi:MFS family permease
VTLPRLPPMISAVAVTTVAQLPNFLTGTLAVQIRSELGIDERELGIAVAAFFLASAVGSPLLGRLADRVGSPRMMRLGAVLSAAVLGGVAAGVHSWVALIAALAFGGAANGGAQPAANLHLTRGVRAERQGFAFGVKQAAIPAAILLAGLAVPAVALTVGWRWAFAGAAVLAVLVATALPAGSRQRAAPARRAPAAAKAAIARRPLLVIACGAGLGSAVANTLGTFFVLSAVAGGTGNGAAGLLAVLGGVASMAMRLGAGRYADRRGRRHLLVVAALLGAGTGGFLLLAAGGTWALVPGAVLAYGLGWGWAGLLNFAIAKRHPAGAGRATGIVQAGTATGGMLGPLSFGFLVSATSYGTGWLADAVALALGALILLAGRRMLLAGYAGPVRDLPHGTDQPVTTRGAA